MQKYNSINVLLCSPKVDGVGGISRWTGHVLNYYQNITEKKINIIFYKTNKQIIYSNTPLLIRLIIGIVSYVPFIIGLLKQLRINKIHIVHLSSSASLGLIRDYIVLKIARKKGVKSVIHFHFGRFPEIYKLRNWEYKLIDKVINLANKVIVLDNQSYNTLSKFGYSNVELIPNPLSPIIQEYIHNHQSTIREERKILFAGHVVETKGIFELINSCKEIPNIKVKIIGHINDSMKSKIITIAGDSCDKWLDIAGEKNFETTIKEMLSAGIFILPSYTEGFPNVIVESMACGCPIVTTKVGAVPEMLDIENGENYGLCVEPKNVTQLKEAILRMLNDREFALLCGLNAKKRVNDLYSMPTIWKKLESIWYYM